MAGLNYYFFPTDYYYPRPPKIISTDDVTVTTAPASVGSGVLERPASSAAFVRRGMLYHDKILKMSTPMAADESRASENVGSTERVLNSESEDTSLDPHVCIFSKKSSNGKNIRKRPMVEESENEDVEGESTVIYTKKKPSAAADHKLHFSTNGSSKSNTPTESSVDSKATRFHFESSKKNQLQTDNRATSTLETESEFSKDARAIWARALKLAEEALKGESKTGGDEKLYKGMNQYIDYKAGLRREHTISNEKAGGAHGPLRASAHIRVSTRFDYQPDICKDYKETGYCGYGDSCKFMHDRGDYKSGWQLEKEWDEAEKERKRKLAMGMFEEDDEDAENDDALPFACFICREPFVDPVVTKCKHYFCEHCALKQHAKNKRCFVCNQPTLGIFNIAFEIRKRMAAQGK